MPEPLKNCYNTQFIQSLANELAQSYADFDQQGFVEYIFDKKWADRELKARMRHISGAFVVFIPLEYVQILNVLKTIKPKALGFEYMFLPDFVECFGLDDYQHSVDALAYFTQFASAEFAVRAFIKQDSHKMMAQMRVWANSDDEHLRRLASEGCRPRLPWACALPEFKQEPSLILPILQVLKNDNSLYVRRSVANNINDIAKDNPEIVVKIAQDWLGENSEVDWVVKHGCRTLLKQANPEIMALFGWEKPTGIIVQDFKISPLINFGGVLEFCFKLCSKQEKLGKLRLEYGIDFMKKNGKTSRKIFKISETNTTQDEKIISKKHNFKTISTRIYYPGKHQLAIIVNGVELDCLPFELCQ